jgi:hypothetical protein
MIMYYEKPKVHLKHNNLLIFMLFLCLLGKKQTRVHVHTHLAHQVLKITLSMT